MEETKGFNETQEEKSERNFNEILRSLASNFNENKQVRRINPPKKDVLKNMITELRGEKLKEYIDFLKQQGKIKNVGDLKGDVRKAYVNDLKEKKVRLRMKNYK